MPRSASRRVTAAGTVEPPRPTVVHELDVRPAVQSGWSSRLVTKYGGPPPIDSPSLVDQLQHLAGVPHIAQVDRRALEHRDQEGAQHADEVSDRRGGQLSPRSGG